MTQCGTACEPSCKNPSPICTKQCVPNLCQCKKGFVRDENNKCVKQTKCPKVSEECGLNEELRECGTACEPSCTNPEPTVCTEQCLVNVCQCKKGFVRDQETTKCVPLEKCSGYSVLQCSARKCPEGSKCVKLEVQEPPKLGNEPRPPVGPVSVCDAEKCFPECVEGQVCKYKDYRDCPTLICARKMQCEPDVSLCNVVKCTAETECKVVETQCLTPPCSYQAKCVPKINNTTCGSFEEFKKCGTACEPSCANLGKDVACTEQCIVDVCQCQKGYVRDENKRCIPEKECPKEPTCSGDHEEMKQCGTACEPSCKNPTPICTKQCVPNLCQCKKGFVRDANNKCVELKECPAEPTCATNEELLKCGTACEPSCKTPNPLCTKQCIPDVCQCKKGFVRDENNKCVQQTQCTAVVEGCEKTECVKGQKCEMKQVKCPRAPCLPVPQCVPDESLCWVVRCGYNTECKVVESECKTPPCEFHAQCLPKAKNTTECGSFEELRCETQCETSCANLGKQCMKVCASSNMICDCQSGYVRDYNKRCIPEEKCPKEPTCGTNEEFLKCGSACQPSCENPNPICTKQCIPDVCQCKKGFVRDEEGKCVEQKECPTERESGCALMDCKPEDVCVEDLTCSEPECMAKCVPREQARPPCYGFDCPVGQECFEKDNVAVCINVTKECGSNEELRQCGTACEPTCINPKPKVCTQQCLVNVCQCKKGFVRDPNTSSCVPLAECSGEARILCTDRKCPEGTTCIQAMNGGSGEPPKILLPDGVTDLPIFVPDPVPSSLPAPSYCIVPVMTCEKARLNCAKNETCGYDSGFPICVPVKKECGSNEEFRACGTACEPYCLMPEQRTCTEKCVENVCQCKEGFMRDLLTKKCVLLEQCRMASMPCSQRKCPEGFFCVDAVSSPPMELPKGPILPGVTGQTIYVTDPPFGNPPSMCTEAPMKCPVNEEYVRCSGCPKNCGEEDKKCALVCGLPGCQCKDGYRRLLHNKMCVKEEECSTLKG